MGTMHAAKLENSPRLQRVRALLSDGAWYGTREIIQRAEVCAVNSVISELRASGVEIASRCVGVGRYEYQLVIPAGQGELF